MKTKKFIDSDFLSISFVDLYLSSGSVLVFQFKILKSEIYALNIFWIFIC